jgi:1,2-phenylacetyl-CoA epoxidase PaaB subunit
MSPVETRTLLWEVFARKAYEDPLHHIGTITADDEDLALVSARSIYDEQRWIEMIIVPRAAIREAIKAWQPQPARTREPLRESS